MVLFARILNRFKTPSVGLGLKNHTTIPTAPQKFNVGHLQRNKLLLKMIGTPEKKFNPKTKALGFAASSG
jgi:hypothetical protein